MDGVHAEGATNRMLLTMNETGMLVCGVKPSKEAEKLCVSVLSVDRKVTDAGEIDRAGFEETIDTVTGAEVSGSREMVIGTDTVAADTREPLGGETLKVPSANTE